MALELILISSSNVIHSDPFDEQRRRSKLSCDSTPHASLGNDEAHQTGSFLLLLLRSRSGRILPDVSNCR